MSELKCPYCKVALDYHQSHDFRTCLEKLAIKERNRRRKKRKAAEVPRASDTK